MVYPVCCLAFMTTVSGIAISCTFFETLHNWAFGSYQMQHLQNILSKKLSHNHQSISLGRCGIASICVSSMIGKNWGGGFTEMFLDTILLVWPCLLLESEFVGELLLWQLILSTLGIVLSLLLIVPLIV